MSNLLNRAFSRREKLLLLVLVIMPGSTTSPRSGTAGIICVNSLSPITVPSLFYYLMNNCVQ